MNRRDRYAALLFGTAALALTATAAAKEPPGFMAGFGFEYMGVIAGLEAWSLPGGEEIWLLAPDGQHVVAGYLYHRTGRDVGSALLGVDPLDGREALEMLTARTSAPDGVIGPGPVTHSDPAGDIGNLLPPPVATAPDRTFAPAGVIGPGPGGHSDPLVEAGNAGTLTPEQRNRLAAELFAAMEAAKTAEEFQAAIIDWNARIQALSGGDASKTQPGFIVPDLPQAAPPALPGQEDQSQIDIPETETISPANMASSDLELFGAMSGLSWFPVGNPSAPPVYIFYDPACPNSSRAIRNLGPRFEAGEFHLRLILVAEVSPHSQPLAAAILGSANPVRALLENALGVAQHGTSPLAPGDFAELPADIQAAVRENGAFLRKYGVRGVPFLGWMAGESPRFLSGVPAQDYDFRARSHRL